MTLTIDLLGWLGACLLLIAYALVSTRRVEGMSVAYQQLNIVGSVLLLSNNAYHGAYPSGFVNLVWTGIAAIALAHALKGDPPVTEHSGLVDLSHTVEDGLITYRGLPAPIICDYLSREESRAHYTDGTTFHIGRIDMVANTGTYLDSPFHRYAHGKDLSQLDLSSLADVPAVVVHSEARRIDASLFEGLSLAGTAVLIHTGWSGHWKTDAYFEGHPYLTEDAALFLRDRGAKLVGIDSLNIDDTRDGRRPVHSTLLAAEIPIVEHLTNLSALPDTGARFFAVPVKVKAFGTFPVRAFAKVPAG